MKYNKVSKKYILNINKFMENFLGIEYVGENKLTHKEMNLYLSEKRLPKPNRISFYSIKEEDVLKGKCLFVKDEINKVLPYENPKIIEELMPILLEEQKENDFSQRRSNCLKNIKIKKISRINPKTEKNN